MDVVGYCLIKKDATTGAAKNIDKFIGHRVRVMEFASDGGVLVISSDASEMAMFDACDVLRKFECTDDGNFIMPPKLDIICQMAYRVKAMSRKGGYVPLLREMVIQASLHKGEFNDGFLWQNQ